MLVNSADLIGHYKTVFGKRFSLSPEASKKIVPSPDEYNEEHLRALENINAIWLSENSRITDEKLSDLWEAPTLDEIQEIVFEN